jgi:hypothetical protein
MYEDVGQVLMFSWLLVGFILPSPQTVAPQKANE